MKKIFLVLFVSFVSLSLFLFFPQNINAQQTSFLLPGINCGVAGDISTNKCCAPPDFSPPDTFNGWMGATSNILDNGIQILANTLLGVVKEVTLKKIVNPITQYTNKYLTPCEVGTASTVDPMDANCRCMISGTPLIGPLESLKAFCTNQTSSNDKNNCNFCITGGGVWTGIGCVQGSINEFVGQTVFGMGIGLAGGFSLLCIIYAAFMMQSSQGNPEKLKKAQEMITSCIMGLMLIIFSVFILRLIGVNIIKIPGFA